MSPYGLKTVLTSDVLLDLSHHVGQTLSLGDLSVLFLIRAHTSGAVKELGFDVLAEDFTPGPLPPISSTAIAHAHYACQIKNQRVPLRSSPHYKV